MSYTRAKLHPVSPFDQTVTRNLGGLVAQVVAAQSKRSPVGLNVRQDVNYADVLAYVQQQGGVKVMLFHCDKSILPNLKPFLPWVDKLIWRPREWTGERIYEQTKFTDIHGVVHRGAAEWVTQRQNEIIAAGLAHTDIWLHLHNEANWSDEMIAWEIEAVERGIIPDHPESSMRFVCLNPGVGTPESTQIPASRRLIELAGKYPNNIDIGLHCYFSVYGWRKAPWYLNRWSFWETYRVSEGLPGVHYVITEFGAEDISDDHAYTDTLPKPDWMDDKAHIGAVYTLDPAWSATYRKAEHNPNPRAYPGLDAAYAQQIDMAFDTGNYLDPRIDGVCLFGWGNKESRWKDYDVSGMSALHALLAKWWKDQQMDTPPPNPPPVEEDTTMMTVKLLHGALGLNAREEKTPLSENLATLKPGDKVGYELPTQAGVDVQGNNQWLHIWLPDKLLWAWVSAYWIEVPIADDPPAPPTGDYVTREELDALKAEVQAFRTNVLKALGELKDNINAELDTVPDQTINLIIDRLQKKEVA